jgi:hypothetical protein
MSERKNVAQHRKRIQNLITGKEDFKRQRKNNRSTRNNSTNSTDDTGNTDGTCTNTSTGTNGDSRVSTSTNNGNITIKRWVPNRKIEGIYQIFGYFKNEILLK